MDVSVSHAKDTNNGVFEPHVGILLEWMSFRSDFL